MLDSPANLTPARVSNPAMGRDGNVAPAGWTEQACWRAR